jgi:hypothetical protein
MDPTDLENALAIREDVGDFDVVWWIRRRILMHSPPCMYAEIVDRRALVVDPDLPAPMHLRACESTAAWAPASSAMTISAMPPTVLAPLWISRGAADRAQAH